jgi:gliding motility-associated lipoprotein GldH
MKQLSWFGILTLVVLLVSCSEKAYYEKVYSFESNEWDQRVKPSFTVDIEDTSKEYIFIVTLRTTTDYKFNNLWIFFHTKTPGGEKGRDPYQIYITNPDGSWIGKKTGTIVEHQLRFNQRKMPQKGKYKFTLEQAITASTIDEVLDIGLRVEEVKLK